MSSFEPRSFRGAYEPLVPPEPMPQYKPPSVIAGHKVIVLIFATVCLALTVYWIRAVRTAKAAPAPVQSVYIEMLPANDPPQPK